MKLPIPLIIRGKKVDNVDVGMKKTLGCNKLKTSTNKVTGLTERSALLVETETKTFDIGTLRKVTSSQIAKQSNALDHFVEEEGVIFAGKHLIIDLWGASRLDDLQFIKTTLESSINECGATLLHIYLHRFTENGGVSGVALLAESHISIHTWPERNYAAVDVFMCGDASPTPAISILRQAFQPTSIQLGDHKRGILT